MKADEMLKKCGYYLIANDENTSTFENYVENTLLVFDKKLKRFKVSFKMNFNDGNSKSINNSLNNAIQKQIKEWGWNND